MESFADHEIRLTSIERAIGNILKIKEATTGKRSQQTYDPYRKVLEFIKARGIIS